MCKEKNCTCVCSDEQSTSKDSGWIGAATDVGGSWLSSTWEVIKGK